MTKSIRLVQETESDSELFVSTLYELPTQEDEDSSTISSTRRVSTIRSIQIKAFYEHHPVYLTIDSGAEINMIRTTLAESIGAPIRQTIQHAFQADGLTPLIASEKYISPYYKMINYSTLMPWLLTI